MTLYAVQKFLYELNRTPALQTAYEEDRHAVLEPYDLTEDETSALVEPDIRQVVSPWSQWTDPYALCCVSPDRMAGLPPAHARRNCELRPCARGCVCNDNQPR